MSRSAALDRDLGEALKLLQAAAAGVDRLCDIQRRQTTARWDIELGEASHAIHQALAILTEAVAPTGVHVWAETLLRFTHVGTTHQLRLR